MQKSDNALYHKTLDFSTLFSFFLAGARGYGKMRGEANRLQAWADLQWNCRKEKIAALKSMNTSLRADAACLTTKAESERLKLQQGLEMERRHTVLQTKTAARFRSTVQSLKTYAESLFSAKE